MNEYTVFALQNKRNGKIYVDITSDIDKPIRLKNLMISDILEGECRKSDFVLYIIGEKLRLSKANDLKIRAILKYESYKSEFGYNDFNEKLNVTIIPPKVYGEPQRRVSK